MKTAILMKNFCLRMCAISVILLISSCHEEDDPEIQYPATGFYGDNILMKGKTEYSAEDYSLQAKLPEGQKVKIIITGKSVTFPTGVWYWEGGTGNNWAISKFDQNTYTQIFQSIDGGHTCDLRMHFDKGTFQIDYYENDAVTPTATKTIEVDY